MHYYTHNIADYRADTSHLTAIEHGIYRQLIDWYYLDEKPIPKETQVVSRRLRLGSEDEARALQNVLSDFFTLQDDGYHQSRCDVEIAKYHAMAIKNRENGKRGGRPKLGTEPEKTQWVISGLATGNPDETQTKGNQEPITNNQELIKKKKEKILRTKICKPDSVDQQVWDDWLVIRKQKRAPLTQTAWDLMLREVDRAGYSIDGAIRECCARNWAGFRDDWIKNATRTSTQSQYKRRSIHDERADTIRQLTGRHREPAGEIIDIGPDPIGLDRAPF